jgi:hypothetical protein
MGKKIKQVKKELRADGEFLREYVALAVGSKAEIRMVKEQ